MSVTILLAINPQTGTATRMHSRAEAAEYKAEGWKLLPLTAMVAQRVRR